MGENIAQVLSNRSAVKLAVISVCDALIQSENELNQVIKAFINLIIAVPDYRAQLPFTSYQV